MRNAIPLCLQQHWITYVKKLEKGVETGYIDEMVSKEKNIELYNLLLQKHKNTIYSKRPNAVGDKLEKRKEIYEGLSLIEQAGVIMQILQLTQLANLGADLTLIGESKKTGITLISKNISETEEFVLINQSPTGLYVSEIDLKTV